MCQDPVMDCVDQIQRAEGMVSEGRMVFFCSPSIAGLQSLGNAVLSQMSVLQLLHLNGTTHRCLQGMPSSGAHPSLDEATPQVCGAALVGRIWMLLAARSVSPHFLPVRRLMTA